MTYRQHSAELAQHMAVLTITGASRRLDTDGLDAALLARKTTLNLISQTLATATGDPRTPQPGWRPSRRGRTDGSTAVENGRVRALLTAGSSRTPARTTQHRRGARGTKSSPSPDCAHNSTRPQRSPLPPRSGHPKHR